MEDARIARVLENLDGMGLGQMLVCDPTSIRYLTGYYTFPYERFLGLYLSRNAEPTLFANVLFPDATPCCDHVVTFADTDDPMRLVADVMDHDAPLGVDKDLAARWLLPLRDMQAAKGFQLASKAVDDARSIKDAHELDLMRAASATNDEAMGWLVDQLHVGVTEIEIAEGLVGEYRRLGAQDNSFTPIVSFGANPADPHHEPDGTKLRERDLVLFDVGCLRDSYCSDMTRTFFWGGEPSDHEREVYECVRRANEAAEAIVSPGVTFAEIDLTARHIIEDAGYGEYFTHRLGHQIGLQDHEPGDVSSTHDEPVRAGMCFSIEPGIYLPGEMGVRIEDLLIVREDGCEVMNSYPKDLTVLGA
ncbi:MAG: Xaa-Pro peptidase family protein [Atopobiaceae bacterium]|jgi:Xaa-Pro dipeptidase|nr:Xaa-Pro peptidase family protein [Atopobiaceae bacterium]MCI2173887.1 Xaa-Pro peptidase family protein [Atopobiaceae bacterium]MCI2208023.1 Xaa-Pro peptidase family protein [Atopobiaceae bacterium]